MLQTIESAATPGGDKASMRKGDFTVGNVLIRKGMLSGIIDIDEWGMTHLPLANYADLVFSYVRAAQNKFWAETMTTLLQGRYSSLPSELRLHSLLNTIGGNKLDVDAAALVAWINHAYYAFQFDTNRLNRETLDLVVVDVLDAVQEHL
jgi:hypothetical protein